MWIVTIRIVFPVIVEVRSCYPRADFEIAQLDVRKREIPLIRTSDRSKPLPLTSLFIASKSNPVHRLDTGIKARTVAA
jgi:hypothetical protein